MLFDILDPGIADLLLLLLVCPLIDCLLLGIIWDPGKLSMSTAGPRAPIILFFDELVVVLFCSY